MAAPFVPKIASGKITSLPAAKAVARSQPAAKPVVRKPGYMGSPLPRKAGPSTLPGYVGTPTPPPNTPRDPGFAPTPNKVITPRAKISLPNQISGTYSIKDLLSKPSAVKPTTEKPSSTKVATTVQKNLAPPVTQIPYSAGNVSPGTATPLDPAATYQPVQVPNLDPFGGRTAAQVANMELNPQIGVINQNTVAGQNAIKGLYNAIVNQLKGYPQEVGQDYNQAQGTINGLAQAAGQQFAAANPNASDQAMLQAIGAPQSQQDAVANKLSNAFNGGGAVLATTQGAIPSASLAASKAAAMQYAQTLPQIQSLEALQASRNLAYNAGLQKNTVEAQAPTIENNVLGAKAGARQTKFSDESANAAAVASNALAKAGYAQNNAALGLKTNQQNFENANTITKLNMSYQKLSDQEIQQANSLGIQKAKLKQTAQRFSSQNASAQSKTLQKVSAQMEDWYYGKPGTEHFDTKTNTWIQAPNGLPPLTYNQSIVRAIGLGLPYQAALALANAYYQPGEGGRPQQFTGAHFANGKLVG